MLNNDAYGLYHLTCEGQCSWYEFAKAIWETLGLTTPLYSSSVKDNPVPVKRPFYSVLENKRYNELGADRMPYWKDALVQYLRSL